MLVFFFSTHLFPSLQPFMNTVVFLLRTWTLPKTLEEARGKEDRMRGYEAQITDCLHSQVVDERAVPFGAFIDSSSNNLVPSSSSAFPLSDEDTVPDENYVKKKKEGGGLEALCSVYSILEHDAVTENGERLNMHAPFEIRFTGSSSLALGPTYSAFTHGTAHQQPFIWLEPIMYRPFNLPTPSRFLRYLSNPSKPFATRTVAIPTSRRQILPCHPAQNLRGRG